MIEQKILQEKVKQADGSVSLRKYKIGCLLGKGGFAKCYQATQLQSNQQVAIKIVNKQNLMKNRAKQKLLSQIKIHRALTHPYIVKFISVFEDQDNVYIVLELCTGRSMSDMVKKRKYLSCQQTRYYILQLLSALQYLHANKVIHRDLKMANIFLSEKMQVKLGDFGLSAKLQFCDQRKRTMAGTPNYIAPQIIQGTSGHSYQVDMWSTGVICYALLFGRPPFETSQLKMTYNRIKNCQYTFPSNIQVPNCAKKFIQQILVIDPKKRLTISQMLDHSFLKGQRPIQMPRSATEVAPHFSKQNLITDKFEVLKNENMVKLSYPKQQGILTINNSRLNKQQQAKIFKNKINKQEPTQNKSLKKQKPSASISKQKQKTNYAQIQAVCSLQQSFGITVVKYVDYSTKYGLGYLLSNGYAGVYFNDSTILAHASNTQNYIYLRDPAHSDEFASYNESNLPNDHNFTKKKVLFQKFEVQLKEQKSNHLSNQINNKKQDIFIRQWLKTKHAIMFRLSNKIFQVDFFDHSQIFLKTDSKKIKFKSKRGDQQFMALSQALNEKQRDTELGRRIKYTKQILNSLKKDQNQNQS